jgi:hypothetical protein
LAAQFGGDPWGKYPGIAVVAALFITVAIAAWYFVNIETVGITVRRLGAGAASILRGV